MRFNGFCEAALELVQEAARAGYPLGFDRVVLDQVHPLLRGVHAIVASRKRVVGAREVLQVPARLARAAPLAYVVGATFQGDRQQAARVAFKALLTPILDALYS